MPPTVTLGPSAHLAWTELGCQNGVPYPLQWRDQRALVLAIEFEAIRTLCGDRPIAVLSAYRPQNYNRRIGGAVHSQHIQGRALDLKAPDGITLQNFQSLIRSRAAAPGSNIKGIGIYPSFLHIDTRPSPHLVTWYGTRKAAEVVKGHS